MRRLPVVLSALAVAAAVLLVWLVTRPDPAVTQPRISKDGTYVVGSVPEGRDAVKAAVRVLPVALSYDYRKLDSGVDAAVGQMTDSFAEEFRKTFNKTAGKMAAEERAASRALVRGAGLIESDGERATCLVFLDQLLATSKDRAESAPITVSKARAVVKLRFVDGTWKVDGIEPF